jgi:pimeloyl-ACP methyl ester carboxylesterase
LITPWANLPDLAQSAYPFVPAKWMVRDRYDNIRNLRDYEGPVAITLCEGDEVVPNRYTERLYEAIQSRKRLWRFTGATHNSWPVAPDESWWDEVVDFVTGLPAGDSSPRAEGKARSGSA